MTKVAPSPARHISSCHEPNRSSRLPPPHHRQAQTTPDHQPPHRHSTGLGAATTAGAYSAAVSTGIDLLSTANAGLALDAVKTAISQIAIDRAQLGAVQSRLNFTSDQLSITKENLSSAISRVADVDVATEATNYARYQILVQSGTQMLTQANQLPQAALQLLR